MGLIISKLRARLRVGGPDSPQNHAPQDNVGSGLPGASFAALRQCGNSTTFCPASGVCCAAQYSPSGYGCRLASRGPEPVQTAAGESLLSWPPPPTGSCCMPGPALPPSTKLPNCLVIGDSVSRMYTGVATKELEGVCKLQHGPWDVSDGGARSTGVGMACLDIFLVTQNQTKVKWDAILFNFGLHNLDNAPAQEEIYRQQLTNITERLVKTGAKLLYALTTPYMPDATVGNLVVHQLNRIAKQVIGPYDISIVDLNTLVHSHCGTVYTTCDWCLGTPCGYHYNAAGETAQGQVVASAFRNALRDSPFIAHGGRTLSERNALRDRDPYYLLLVFPLLLLMGPLFLLWSYLKYGCLDMPTGHIPLKRIMPCGGEDDSSEEEYSSDGG